MLDKIVDKVAEAGARRSFLGRLAAAAAAVLLGPAQAARGVEKVGCCELCSASRNCNYSCKWCWCCWNQSEGHCYQCTEYYGEPCNGNCFGASCSGVVCSAAYIINYASCPSGPCASGGCTNRAPGTC